LDTRETVATETPASRAISLTVIRLLLTTASFLNLLFFDLIDGNR
jgi:hypothetical protein